MGIFTPKVSGRRELSLAEDLALDGKYEDALDMAKQALQEIKKAGNVTDVNFANAKILEIQGEMHESQDNLVNAIGAYGQSARYYNQASASNEMIKIYKKHIEMLRELGQRQAQEKKFESAAASYEKAALSCKEISREIEALEFKAKAFVFRAASVREPNSRKNFLMQAVYLIRDSGMKQPIVMGHLEYYTAMVERMSSQEKAIASLNRAISYYEDANRPSLVASARSLQESILASSTSLQQ